MIGISTGNDGKLSLDKSETQDALDDYFEDVQALFIDEDGFSAAALERLEMYVDPIDGTLESYKDSVEERIDDLEKQIEVYEKRIANEEARLRDSFNSMEAALGSMTGAQLYLGYLLSGGL